MNDALDRAVDFLREFDRRCAALAIRSAHGTAYLTPTLPRVYDLNMLLVDRGAEASAAELIAEPDEIFRSHGLPHRKVAVDDRLALAVEGGFREAGWQVQELVVVPHMGRRRLVGLGKAVVAGALAASRELHDSTFLVADAHDWPKELYRKLGFEPVGSVYRFLLRPGA